MAKELSPQAAEKIRFARNIMGAAGHEVTDPILLDILRQSAEGEITSDEATKLIVARVYEKNHPSESPTINIVPQSA